MSIGNKRVWIFLILLTNSLIFFILFLSYFHAQQNIFKNEEKIIIDLQEEELDYYFEKAKSDLFLLSDLFDMFKKEGNITENKSSIESLFINFANEKKQYDQIRFIDSTGYEKIRVNYSYNQSSIVPDSLLQDKSDRYYFTETKKLEKGQIYLSPFDLNIEKVKLRFLIK